MEYPIWHLTTFGGGFWVALIATIHVFVAQFAVGGGLFLVLTERYSYRRESPAVTDYVKRHSLFFLLLTMVFGGLSGVGIWFVIGLLSPEGTAILIHNFVFAWASEWVFFLGEIVALLIYYCGWKRLSRRDHMTVGWLYFLFAWGSLFLINGIVAFMLTPGEWIRTGNFWDGFFNPTFWPQLIFRSFLSFTLAGLFGFLTATRIRDDHERMRLVRLCSLWTILPFILMVASGWWYITGLPEPQFTIAIERSNRVALYLRDFVTLSPVLVLGALLLAVRLPRKVSFPLALVVLLLGLGVSGSFEFIREAARKPFVVYGDVWSNSIKPAQLAEINKRGAIASAKWAPPGLKVEDTLAAGEFLFQLECASCHSIGGPMNDILPRTAKYPLVGMDSLIEGLGRINRSMPFFAGTPEERMALATYIVEGLHGKKDTGNAAFEPVDLPVDIPLFNPADPDQGGSKYVLLGWNNLGMHCISDSNRNWVLLPPANDIFAQLVERGDPPSVVTEGVTMEYAVEPAFRHPEKHTDFWKYAHIIFGKDKPLPEGVGLSGNGVVGTMESDGSGVYDAKLVPVVPYPDDRAFNPYPLFTITAKDEKTGKVLAQTKIVAPTSTEMGCKNCHGGPWKEGDLAGISDQTGYDVLTTHDRMNGTRLAARADAGKPVLCQSCHPDPVLGSKGDPVHYPGLMNLPAALHGLHANYLTGRGAEVCTYCHPNRPDGPTKCLRGRHAEMASCTDCHGYLEDHALSLLKAESDKRGAARLMANLQPRTVADKADVNPRIPWLQEPDCLTCHKDFQAPETVNAYNTWSKDGAHLYRNRMDDTGSVACIGCHNSPHATWPADNIYGKDRDNVVPLQYMGKAGSMGTEGNCICHTVRPDYSAHHDNMWPR